MLEIDIKIAKLIINILPESIIIFFSQKKAQKIANKALRNSKGYKTFLLQNNVLALPKVFTSLPIMDKANYVLDNKIQDLSRIPVSDAYTIETSSGYSGNTFYWPRSKSQDKNAEFYMRMGLILNFQIDKKRTLILNTFALGTWVTGEKLSRVLKSIAMHNKYALTVVSIGSDPYQVISIIKVFYSFYEQIIIAGYPPFLKHVVEELAKADVKVITPIHFISGGEELPFSLREYIASQMSKYNNQGTKIYSAYGAAEVGLTVGYENDFCVEILSYAIKNKKLRKELFGRSDIIPNLIQYNPINNYIECENGELLFTSDTCVPLVRYNIHDVGGIILCSKLLSIVNKYKLNIKNKDKILHLPFIYIFGRSDGTISIKGANIYLHHLHVAMNRESITKYHTGKYHMHKSYEENNPKIVIEVELKNEYTNNTEVLDEIKYAIIEDFRLLNKEYEDSYKSFASTMTPEVIAISQKAIQSDAKSSKIKNKYIKTSR